MPFAENVQLVGYDDLDGRSGFKLAMHEVDERFYLYVAALWEPGLSIVEVTDPANPRFVRWLPGPAGTSTVQVQVADGLMVTNMEPIIPGWGDVSPTFEEGIAIWDLADPEDPQILGKWATGVGGTHRNFYAGGRYVHAAAKLPGFAGHVYAVVDIDDPEHPELVGRWWWPGQHEEGGESWSEDDAAKITSGRPLELGMHTPPLSLHAGPYVEGDRAYCAWMRAGFVILDVSTPAQPELISKLPVYPPLGSSIAMHTAVPLPERQLVVINSEALNDRCREPVNFAGIVDVSDERDPVLISLFPTPVAPEGYTAPSFCSKGGRFGPHNQHQPQRQPCLQPVGDYIYLTYFNAGLQVFDISDPYTPRIAGYYIADDPKTRRGRLPVDLVTQFEDVLVDRRGNVYVTDKNDGVSILRFQAA
ncbi:MAG TPA: hypothetical protein VII51_07865 [Gaiellaceae bacterium]